MRIRKNLQAKTKRELAKKIEGLRNDGWRCGIRRTEIDALYPYKCMMWKDLPTKTKRNEVSL